MSVPEPSDEEIARVHTTETQMIAIKTPRHWTGSIPLWGIFGALTLAVASMATLSTKLENLQGTVATWNAIAVKRADMFEEACSRRFQLLEEAHQAELRWRAVHEAAVSRRR